MLLRKSIITAAASLVAAGALTIATPSYAQDGPQPRHTAEEIAKSKPSATFELEAEQLRLLLGGAQGKGTLFYQGKPYPFTIKALTAGGIGATKITASGDVYFLQNVQDFAGKYSAVTAGAALGAGFGGSQYENNKGVYVRVKSKTEGVGLNLGLGVVEVSFVQ